MKKKRFIKCTHLDWDNQQDCEEQAEKACLCCAMPVCLEHNEKICPYGGEPYMDIEDFNL